MAILNKYREVFCGGTLVAPGWILTAAHCVRKHLFVRLGEYDLVEREGSELEYAVKVAKIHPLYNPDTVDNDVALLQIPTLNAAEDGVGETETAEMNFSKRMMSEPFWGGNTNVRRNAARKGLHRFLGGGNFKAEESTTPFPSACLPEQEEDLPDKTHCMIIGWGKTQSSHVYGTEVLHEAKVGLLFMYLFL